MHLSLPLFQIFTAFIACAPAEFLKKFGYINRSG
jgi:hypothetical protein